MLLHFILTFCLNRDYIVLFKANNNRFRANAFARTVRYLGKNDKIKHRLNNGFIANFSEGTKNKLKNLSEIQVIEEDQPILAMRKEAQITFKEVFFSNEKLKERDLIFLPIFQDNLAEEFKEDLLQFSKKENFIYQKNAPWGLKKISDVDNLSYIYPQSSGLGVTVYVIDTGIDINHSEFENRASWGINLVEDSPDLDENGHGTHVAGIIGGKNVGIAKKSNLVAVKVLGKDGSGMISKVLMGIDYVINQHSNEMEEFDLKNLHGSFLFEKMKDFLKNKKKPKSIINMSVGGLKSKALEFTMEYATDLDIHFAVAAGNDTEDACDFSPGSSKHAITVGASTVNDKVAFFSNYGNCVNLYAPGMDILSSWLFDSYKYVSGTSMATPHVSGVLALYLSEKEYKPKELMEVVIKDSRSIVKGRDGNLPFLSTVNFLMRLSE